MAQGWIKLHRQLRESLVYKNSELLHLWIHLLLKATHTSFEQLVGTQKVPLEPGQFIFGRKKVAEDLNLTESKIYRYIKLLENENCLSVKSNNKYSVGTIVNWELYQLDDEDVEQQMNNKRTTNEQQMNTNKNVKNEKNEKKEYICKIYEYFCSKLQTKPKLTSQRKSKINSRLKDFTPDQIKLAIDNLAADPWIRGDNPNGKNYATIDYLFRSTEKMDEWVNKTPSKPLPKGQANREPDEDDEYAYLYLS